MSNKAWDSGTVVQFGPVYVQGIPEINPSVPGNADAIAERSTSQSLPGAVSNSNPNRRIGYALSNCEWFWFFSCQQLKCQQFAK